MTTGPAITWDLSVTEKSPRATITWIINVASGRNDFIRWDLTVTNFLDVVAQAWRMIGKRIEMDLGDGALSTVQDKDLAPEIRLSGSIHGFGVRELTFSRYGEDQSTFQRTLTRAMQRVRMTAYRGVPGAIGSREMFDGYIRDALFQGFPPVAQIVCQDTSLAYAETPIAYNLEPGSLRERADVILEVLASAGIPAGVFDAPQGTGIFFKALSEAGDRKVLDWLSQVIEPIGARGYWRGGKWNLKRFDTSGPAKRTLKAGDFRTISIDPPATNTPNAVQVSSALFAYQGPSGGFTTTETQSARAVYAPKAAVLKQDHTTGTQTVVSAAIPAADREVSRIVTTTTKNGGTMVSQMVDEWGWYAPRAAARRQTTGGVNTFNNANDVYQYADGSWRSTQQEDFQIIRRRIVSRTFDTDGFLVSESETPYQFYGMEIPRGTLNPASGAEVPSDVLMTDDGIAWIGGVEQFAYEINTVTYAPAVAGQPALGTKTRSVNSWGNVVYSLSGNPGGAYAGPTIYFFGPTASKKYGTGPSTAQVLLVVSTTYSAIDEASHHEDTRAIFRASQFPQTFQQLTDSNVTVAGPVPNIEQLTAFQQAQNRTQIIKDNLRIALSLGKQITDYRQNDYCETAGEMQTVAVEALRAISAPRVTIEMDCDFIIEEGDIIAVDHPKLGYGPVKLLVEDIIWTLNGSTGQNNQTLGCRWDTPELLAAT